MMCVIMRKLITQTNERFPERLKRERAGGLSLEGVAGMARDAQLTVLLHAASFCSIMHVGGGYGPKAEQTKEPSNSR